MEYDHITYEKSACAALAFHKSLIGLSQLNALESASKDSGLTQFLESRAILTYYVAYHLFASSMLLVPDAYLKKPLSAPSKYGTVTEEEINSPLETPQQWNDCQRNEMDWATAITHSQIKDFCKRMRELDHNFPPQVSFLRPLYDHFIDPTGSEEKCIPGLYEKLCYVRDRVIYRPSYVLTHSGHIVQTSAQLHSEITSLPTSEILHHAISDIYLEIIRAMETERSCKAQPHPCTLMLSQLWCGKVRDDLDDLCALGHKRRRLQYLGKKEPDGKKYAFPTYVCHLLELESIDFIHKYRKKYWNPLEKQYIESCEAWRSRHHPS